MKFDYKHDKEEWRRAALAIRGTVAGAARAAFQDLAKQVQRQGRAEIASAGLSRRWQSGFRTYVFPRRPSPTSAELTMRGQHRRGYANIFERGGTIRPRKGQFLWVPLPTAPDRINGKPTTAAEYVRSVGPLHSINRPGRAPLLAGYVMRSRAVVQTRGGRALVRSGKVTVAQLRAGQRSRIRRRLPGLFPGQRRPISIPLFVGLKASQIRDRLNVSAVYDRGRADLPRLYAKHLALLNRDR